MLNLKKNNINLYKVIIYNKIDSAININTFSDYINNLINNNPSILTHTISNNIYYLWDDNIHFSKWLIKKIKLKIGNIDVIKYKLYNSLGLFCEYNELELNNVSFMSTQNLFPTNDFSLSNRIGLVEINFNNHSNLFIRNLFIILTQNNFKLMRFNNIKTLLTMMKTANYYHSKIV